jgi:choline dehydrogenase-like flavoprotein
MHNESDMVDVLVIGAGASGGAFTWSLSNSGINVMCLDQGGWINPDTYPTTKNDWEIHGYTDFSPDPNVRQLPQDYPVNDTESDVTPLMYNAVGGSTIHWSAHLPRFHPSDFRVKSLDGVAEDWPITYDQLEPFFDLNDQMIGVAGMTGDTAYPPKSPRQTPPIPLGKLGNTIVKGFDELGWHWWPSDSAILTKEYDGRSACNNCGPCFLGCTTRAKASTDVTYWPKSLANGALLKTYARVKEISVGKDGLVDGVIYYDVNNQIQKQKARIVVIAANGVGTPRLLLNSKSGLFPDGLANHSGMVGKNLMFHPFATVTGVFSENLESYKGPIGCSVLSHEFYETDPSRDFVRGYGLQVVRSSGPVHTAVGGIGGHTIPWGESHHGIFSERFGKTISVGVMGEDLPEECNQVLLDKNLTDSDSIPAAKVIYRMSNNSLKMVDHGIARAGELLEASGANQVLVNPLLKPSGWHLMGTTTMGTNPNQSVVNDWGRCHDVKNLFIIDSSIFVTGAAVNPTTTIQALALYIADKFKQHSRHLID